MCLGAKMPTLKCSFSVWLYRVVLGIVGEEGVLLGRGMRFTPEALPSLGAIRRFVCLCLCDIVCA